MKESSLEEIIDARTREIFQDPQVGDHLTEMFSFHAVVVKVTDKAVYVVEGYGGQTMPEDGKLRRFDRADWGTKAYAYGSIPGWYVNALPHRMKPNVAEWFDELVDKLMAES